ncbi:ATP-binding protein [Hymenobacter busanensis]|uniref:ATP-binding protein n=1 Tax=Hymenobacter busanensis TaxID=2607656 RepID=A0A7L5A1B9_9BACT|nr:ATP-binding protein [Hymenobacter busanensis]KAA9338568.1 ATP-binding protein [Hymenobacter busanensis]QHJ09003.1 ATP-binding protein [Hymenobacter busanensis]
MNHSLRVSCSRQNLKVVRDFVGEFLAEYGLSAILQNQIILAVDEIVANLIIHSNHEDESKFLDIRLAVENNEFRFEAEDGGASFSPSGYQDPDMEEHIRQAKKGGVGIALVNRIMDHVEYSSVGTRNFCRLTKRLG